MVARVSAASRPPRRPRTPASILLADLGPGLHPPRRRQPTCAAPRGAQVAARVSAASAPLAGDSPTFSTAVPRSASGISSFAGCYCFARQAITSCSLRLRNNNILSDCSRRECGASATAIPVRTRLRVSYLFCYCTVGFVHNNHSNLYV